MNGFWLIQRCFTLASQKDFSNNVTRIPHNHTEGSLSRVNKLIWNLENFINFLEILKDQYSLNQKHLVALELGSRNIRSNVIAPGFIETEMTDKLSEEVVQGWRDGIPLKRGGQPEDVANACVFLASDLSSYITGQVLHVDGGMLT